MKNTGGRNSFWATTIGMMTATAGLITALATLYVSLHGTPDPSLIPSQTPSPTSPPTSIPTQSPTSSPTLAPTPSPTPFKINNPPSAFIDSIYPNNVTQGNSVTFRGHGNDTDERDFISGYWWESSIEGFLSDKKIYSTSSLRAGSHKITLRVKDSHGEWSEGVTQTLIVKLNSSIIIGIDINKTRL